MKITVLDAKPLDAGDIDWSPLHQLGSLTLHERTTTEELNGRIGGADVVFTNKVKLPRSAFQSAPVLKMVGVLATGYDVIELQAAREYGVVVSNVPNYSTAFTAQSSWALLLELTHHVGIHNEAVHSGQWTRSPHFSFWNYPLFELEGKTLVIVGLGSIGRRVATIAQAFGMNVIAAQLPGRRPENASNIPYLPLEKAIAKADVISLHCPATMQTRGLVDEEFLFHLKPGVLLVNASRGALVDEGALAAALNSRRVGGYAADVLSQEPPPAANPLLGAPNCILTPHLSWASPECRQRIIQTSAANLQAFLDGNPQNVVG